MAASNGTIANKHMVVNNGRYSHQKLIQTEQWNGYTEFPNHFWPPVGPTPQATDSGHAGVCREIQGTDATQFAPYLDKDLKLWVFIPGMCRSIWLTYQGESNVGKIKTWNYRPPFEVFDMENEENFCYCPTFFECAHRMEGD